MNMMLRVLIFLLGLPSLINIPYYIFNNYYINMFFHMAVDKLAGLFIVTTLLLATRMVTTILFLMEQKNKMLKGGFR